MRRKLEELNKALAEKGPTNRLESSDNVAASNFNPLGSPTGNQI